jgi:hypothetical protein
MKTRQRRAVTFLAAAVLLATTTLFACSVLLPLDAEQCSVDSDCTSRGGAFAGSVCQSNVCVLPEASVEAGPGDGGREAEAAPVDAGPWGCLDQPPQPLDPNATIAITGVMFDALKPITGAQGASDIAYPTSYTPVPGIALQACNTLDPKCSKPITPLLVSDDAGIVNFTLPGNFSGFFQFSGAGALPSTVYPGNLLADASSEALPMAVLGANEGQLLASALGVNFETNPEAGVGSTFFQVYDCYDKAAPGVSFTLAIDGGPETVQWYSNNQLPSTTATQTDSLGAGGALNVPAGALSVTATLVATHRTLGTANAIVNAGGLTYAWFRVRTTH